MKSVICPHCGNKIVAVKKAHFQEAAVADVIRLARAAQPNPVHVRRLASRYAWATGCTFGAGRRAIERLAKDGYLQRITPGLYTVPGRKK
jgi:hypothetical protein